MLINYSSEKKWFIAQIKPNSYNTAIQNLERQGFETFLPKMNITLRQKNKFIIIDTFWTKNERDWVLWTP